MSEGERIGKLLKSKCKEATNNTSASIKAFYEKFGCICPEVLMDLYKTFSGGFVERFPGETVLFYDVDTLLEKGKELIPVDTRATGLLPIADFKDNQFLCYHPMKKVYVLYSAIDEITVLVDTSLLSILSTLEIQQETG